MGNDAKWTERQVTYHGEVVESHKIKVGHTSILCQNHELNMKFAKLLGEHLEALAELEKIKATL